MDQKFQSSDVPESTIPRSSKKELPWFVCAAITTCLVVICYEYSESLEGSPTNTSKGAKRTVQTTRNSDVSMSNEMNSHADEQEDSDAMGRTVFNVITMIICCIALIVTWSSKSTEHSDITTKNKEEKEESKKDK